MIYNVFTETGGYRVTKWDQDMNIEASYLVTSSTCDCPSRNKPCKHVNLVGVAIAMKTVDTQNFFDPDTAKWHLFIPTELIRPMRPAWRRV